MAFPLLPPFSFPVRVRQVARSEYFCSRFNHGPFDQVAMLPNLAVIFQVIVVQGGWNGEPLPSALIHSSHAEPSFWWNVVQLIDQVNAGINLIYNMDLLFGLINIGFCFFLFDTFNTLYIEIIDAASSFRFNRVFNIMKFI